MVFVVQFVVAMVLQGWMLHQVGGYHERAYFDVGVFNPPAPSKCQLVSTKEIMRMPRNVPVTVSVTLRMALSLP